MICSGCIFLTDGYRIDVELDPRDKKIIGLQVRIDKSSSAKRGDVVIDGYWNHSGAVKPGAVLGASLMKDKFDDGCIPEVDGGLTTNTDPSYSCVTSGPHSQGWVGVRLYLEAPSHEEIDAYDLSRLRDEIEDGPDPGAWPLGKDQAKQLAKEAKILPTDDKSTKRVKIDAAIVEKFKNYTVTGYEIFNDLVAR